MFGSVRKLLVRISKREHWAGAMIAVLVALVCFVSSLQFSGPVILSDEASYMTKAAALAGHPTDTASSYHAGYPLIVSPAFMLFDDAVSAWRAALFISALMWGASFYLLSRLLRRMFPKESGPKLLGITLISVLYPAWIVMSTYAFTGSAFLLVLMLCLLLLTAARRSMVRSAALGLGIGFLYWIHPIALAFIAPVLLLLFCDAIANGRHKYFIVTAIFAAAAVLAYMSVFHPWLNDLMTPDGLPEWDHYSLVTDQTGGLVQRFADPGFLQKLLAMFAGQTSQILVSSFGLVGFALMALRDTAQSKKRPGIRRLRLFLEDKKAVVTVVIGLSLIGTILLGSVNFLLYWSDAGRAMPLNMQHWLYGRYTDMFVLPLIAVGAMVAWSLRRAVVFAGIAVASGLLITVTANPSNTSDRLQEVSASSFWPILVQGPASYLYWFVLGAFGILLVHVMVHLFGRKAAFIVIGPIVVMSIIIHMGIHHKQGLLVENPSQDSLIELISSTYKGSECIGLEYSNSSVSESMERNSLRFIAFANFTKDVRRMTLPEWREGCDGPYLTVLVHDDKELGDARYVAREKKLGGIYLIAKPEAIGRMQGSVTDNENIYINTGDQECVISGCVEEYAEDLHQTSAVGDFRDGWLATDGREGIFVVGASHRFRPGSFTLIFDAYVENSVESAPKLSLVSAETGIVYFEGKLSTDGTYDFQLQEDVDDLQLMIEVDSADRVELVSYKIK